MIFIEEVLKFATKAHHGQQRKYTGQPYITHPVAVAEIAAKKYKEMVGEYAMMDSGTIKAVALLHDVLEDTKVTEQELLSFLETIIQKPHAEFIVSQVKLLTKFKTDFQLFPYLDGLRKSTVARVVKLADLEHNMSDLKDQKKAGLLQAYPLLSNPLT